jgi:hypothetical protein
MRVTIRVILILATSPALAGEACLTTGRLTHCWDSVTGKMISTTERRGDYEHTWTPDGRAWTTEHRGALSHTWRTR